jgi:hypothetical protein
MSLGLLLEAMVLPLLLLLLLRIRVRDLDRGQAAGEV